MGMESMVERGDGGLEKQISAAERELRKVQPQEERAIGLYVSGKVTVDQLDHQRRLMHERLETVRARLDDYRALRLAAAERKALTGNIADWSRRIGDRLDDLPDEERMDLLRLVLDRIAIDRDNTVTIALGIPIQGLVSI